MTAAVIISCRNLTKVYGSGPSAVHALRNISFDVLQGESLAILGHSGSGKSTLLQIIGCLDKPSSGEYFLNQKEASSLDDDSLSELRGNAIGFVFQAFHLFPRMDLIENVALPLYYQGVGREERITRARQALETVKLGHRTHHHPHQISGGEKQRVAIARAIVHKPNIILADEPTGNLDSHVKQEILEHLGQLNAELGVTLILVTHDETTARFAQKTLLIRDGEVHHDAF